MYIVFYPSHLKVLATMYVLVTNQEFVSFNEKNTYQILSFRISSRWPIYIINPVDKTNDYLVIHPTDEEPQFH